MRIIIFLLLGAGLLAIVTKKPLPVKHILPAKMNRGVEVKINDKLYFLLEAPASNEGVVALPAGYIWVIQRQ